MQRTLSTTTIRASGAHDSWVGACPVHAGDRGQEPHGAVLRHDLPARQEGGLQRQGEHGPLTSTLRPAFAHVLVSVSPPPSWVCARTRM